MPMLDRTAAPAGPDVTAAAIADIRAALSAQVHAEAGEYAGEEYDEEPVLESQPVAEDGPAVRETFGHGKIRLHER
jgi:hypothetical protein